MPLHVKHLIKRTCRSLGYDIIKYRKNACFNPFNMFDVGCVFDIGANVGQFAKDIRQIGYRNRIVSFEPSATAYAALQDQAQDDQHWIIHERAAVGEAPGVATLNVANNSVSSSILPMLDTHWRAAPNSVYTDETEPVPVISLDSVFEQYAATSGANYLKIDTQGYEMPVLVGAAESLEHISIINVELSLTPLYEGAAPCEDVIAYLSERGFEMWDFTPVFRDPACGRLLQGDGLFVSQRLQT